MDKHFVERVNNWNAKRYEQELDVNLANALLDEECEELDEACEAQDYIEVLDALGDIAFVAVGILWKAGVSSVDIKAMFDSFDYTGTLLAKRTHITYYTCTFAADYNTSAKDAERKVICKAMALIEHCIDMMNMMECAVAFPELVGIICASNETKAVPSDKVDASVKANVDKGSSFVSPTKALEAFAATYMEELMKEPVEVGSNVVTLKPATDEELDDE